MQYIFWHLNKHKEKPTGVSRALRQQNTISHMKHSGWQSCEGEDYSLFPTLYHMFKR